MDSAIAEFVILKRLSRLRCAEQVRRQMQNLAILSLSREIFSNDCAIADLPYDCWRFPVICKAVLNQNWSRGDALHSLHVLDDIDNIFQADFHENVTALCGNHGLSTEFGRIGGFFGIFRTALDQQQLPNRSVKSAIRCVSNATFSSIIAFSLRSRSVLSACSLAS
jgi:hypothetical protein